MNSGAAGTDRGYPGSSRGGYRSKRYTRAVGERQNAARYHCSPGKRYLESGGARFSSQVNGRAVATEQDFNRLISRETFAALDKKAASFGEDYDGKGHSQYATLVKQYTSTCKRSLSREEQNCLMPLLRSFQPTTNWSWRSVTTTIHSLTSAGVFTPQKPPSDETRHSQLSLLGDLLETVLQKCTQRSGVSGLDAKGIANLLWAMANLSNNCRELKTTLNEAVTAVLPRVMALKDQFISQGITNLLWAMAKLVDNGYVQTTALQEAVLSLLPRVSELQQQFIGQAVANLLWAMAKLVDNDQVLISDLSAALTALLPRVIDLHGQLTPQNIANLMWATAKLVDNGYERTPVLQEVILTLLSCICAQKDHFIPQHISNLLCSMAKLVDNGYARTPLLQEVMVTLLSCVRTHKDQFGAQHIANLLWAMAKMVDSGQALTSPFKKTVVALLPQIRVCQDQFNAQHIANLLWALAKVVDKGQKLTSDFQAVVIALLPRVNALTDQFSAQGIANLLWAMAKLLNRGHALVPEFAAAVTALFWQVKALQVRFNPQEIANMLWAIAHFGELINAEISDSVVQTILSEFDGCLLFTPRDLVISLWALLVCCARQYLHKNTRNNTLERLTGELFHRLTGTVIDHEQDKSIMAMAASWLGRECLLKPHYVSDNSTAQLFFCTQLQSALPSLKIEQERSIHSLPPVDLLLPEHNVAIEIQGASHYLGRDFETRNGPTLLKIALLQKAGYDVVEIPVNQLNNPDSVESYIAQIQRKAT